MVSFIILRSAHARLCAKSLLRFYTYVQHTQDYAQSRASHFPLLTQLPLLIILRSLSEEKAPVLYKYNGALLSSLAELVLYIFSGASNPNTSMHTSKISLQSKRRAIYPAFFVSSASVKILVS